MSNLSSLHQLLGDIALSKGELALAQEEYNLALTFADRLEIHYSLGLVHVRSGDRTRAQEQFAFLISNPWPNYFDGYPDLYALSFFQLGRLNEAESPTASADYFEKFLDLWGEHGSGLPEVQLAREKVAYRP